VVTKLTPPTGAISVTRLFGDRAGNLWAGTHNGLARFNNADSSWSLFDTTNNGIGSLSPNANLITDIAQRGEHMQTTSQFLMNLSGAGVRLQEDRVSRDGGLVIALEERTARLLHPLERADEGRAVVGFPVRYALGAADISQRGQAPDFIRGFSGGAPVTGRTAKGRNNGE